MTPDETVPDRIKSGKAARKESSLKPVAIDDFCRLKFLSGITWSPSGKTAALAVSEADRKQNGYRSFLYVYQDKKLKKLTSFGKERSFQYLDEDTLLFAGDREKEESGQSPASRYYRISLSGGEAETAYEFPIPVSRVLPLPGGDLLAVGSTFPGFENLYEGSPRTAAAWKKHREENADYEEIAQVPWWWNGSTYTKGAYSSLFYYDSAKKKLRRLTGLNESVFGAELSPDKQTVFYLSRPVAPLLPLHGNVSVWKQMLPAGERTLLAESREGFEPEWVAPADSFLLLAAHDGSHGLNTDGDFWKIDYTSGELSFYARHGESIGSSVGTDIRYGGGRSAQIEGDVLYFVSTRFDSAGLYKLENGTVAPVITREGSVDCFDVKNGKILLIGLYGMKAQELYDGSLRRLSSFNEAALRGRYVAQPEPLSFTRAGQDLHGFVLKPLGFDPARKYPVILDIHGGPKTVYGPVFYHEMQYWAGKGYFVIFCNPTGSDGRGAFSDIRGRYGTDDYEDLMAFCDEALKAYPAMDADNFFATGGSYGGFMINWIIGHTHRFRACASQRSISNWFSFYGVADIGVGFAMDQCAADPWKDPAGLWARSPMSYADRAKTPTLFIHSFEDYRCPVDQGYQMFTALTAHGVESRMVCFRGENHELSRSGKPKHRLKRLSEITGWFDSHRG